MSFSAAIECARIDPPTDPFQLYQTWANNYKNNEKNAVVVMNLATISDSGKVTNRSLILRELYNKQFVFTTTRHSLKIQDIEENPNVAACFYFKYEMDNKHILQQIRIEGKAVKLPQDYVDLLYSKEPHFAKIRYHVVEKQGKPIDWNRLKAQVDSYVVNSQNFNQLKFTPDYYVAYGVAAEYMDFYYTYDTAIADRVCYIKEETCKKGCENGWQIQRLTP